MHTREIEYADGELTLRGYFATDSTQPRPCVLIAHPWVGRGAFVIEKAKYLAELGYAGFAVDMYGDARLGAGKDECAALMNPLLSDRDHIKARMLAALECVQGLPDVDSTSIAAMGYCFGGMCVLDLARSGVDIKGVVSFHGLLESPRDTDTKCKENDAAKIAAKVLVLHGHDDPMVTPDRVMAFTREMTKAEADWQIHMYGHTMHAFTNPEANDKAFGTVYDETADKRSLIAMKNFLAEIF